MALPHDNPSKPRIDSKTLGEEPFLLTQELPQPVTLRLQKATLAGLEDPNLKISPSVQAGIEERMAERFRMLTEGRTDRGVLVVPDTMAARSQGLRKFLARLPDELAASVVLWGEDPLLDRLNQRNPALQRFRGNLLELGLYLVEKQEADRVGILSDQEAVAVLAPRMKRLGISVTLVRWNISEILEILGDPQEVSSQVDLDRLVGELFTDRGT